MAKINKEKLLSFLIEKKNFNMETSNIISDILKKHSIIGRKNKERIINDFIVSLSISYSSANHLYNDCMEIILKG